MMKNIRNFCILAHIDHGKSTLADRFLELTAAVAERKMRAQYLDMHPLERERGITIKMQPVRMAYEAYILNLIDTPGHADFSYEVSRALAAVEGAILLVDATQGVQAQTIANLHAAQREGLTIIPAINKIDLPSAEAERTEEEIIRLLACSREDIYRVSAKDGTGVEDLLGAVVEKIPPPGEKFKNLNSEMWKEDARSGAPLRALVFDSKYDPYLGVMAHIRIMDGELKKGERMIFMASGAYADALEIGVFLPERSEAASLSAGEIGYVATGLKKPAAVRVGDTIIARTDADGTRTDAEKCNILPLAGYREPSPMVFATLFPEDQNEYETLRDAMDKLKLEDAAFTFAPEDAGTLGRGFRAGFLGLLHMEIIAERIRREYGVSLALTHPSVAFRVVTRAGGGTRGGGIAGTSPLHSTSDDNVGSGMLTVYAASRLPPAHEIVSLEEPWARVDVVTPAAYLGALTTLVSEVAGSMSATETLVGNLLLISFEAPLREIIIDFYDRIKSVSHGFASFSYEPIGYRAGDLVRLDIIIADEIQPSLAEVVPAASAYARGRSRLAALKELLPAELFAIALQAAVGGKVIARETIAAAKKDVTAHMYGGDRTRKMKLWKKQQKGKKRLQETGRVNIPPEIFFKLHRR